MSLRLFDTVVHETTGLVPPLCNVEVKYTYPMQTTARLLQTLKNHTHIVEGAVPINNSNSAAKPQNYSCPLRGYLEGNTPESRRKKSRSKQGECFYTCSWVWL